MGIKSLFDYFRFDYMDWYPNGKHLNIYFILMNQLVTLQ